MTIPECSVACQHVFERAFFYFGVACSIYFLSLLVLGWLRKMTHHEDQRDDFAVWDVEICEDLLNRHLAGESVLFDQDSQEA